VTWWSIPAADARPAGTEPFWLLGEHIWWVYRNPAWQPGGPQTVHPMTVVHDDADALVAWLAGETPVLVPRLADGGSLREGPARTMFTAPRIQGRGIWQGAGTLRISPTGAPWSVWVFWTPAGKLIDYYVNLEDPHRRAGHASLTSDHVLDVVVQPDRQHRRKDVDELAEAVRQGRYTAEQAAGFERDAAAAEAIAEAWGSPFGDGWDSWRPDPSWPVPPLPEGVPFDLDVLDPPAADPAPDAAATS